MANRRAVSSGSFLDKLILRVFLQVKGWLALA
jgi:hypothetical protein